jgi:hypothetical protein
MQAVWVLPRDAGKGQQSAGVQTLNTTGLNVG